MIHHPDRPCLKPLRHHPINEMKVLKTVVHMRSYWGKFYGYSDHQRFLSFNMGTSIDDEDETTEEQEEFSSQFLAVMVVGVNLPH